MYSFTSRYGLYGGRPVAAGTACSNPIASRSKLSANTSMNRAGLSSGISSSMHPMLMVIWRLSTPAMWLMQIPPLLCAENGIRMDAPCIDVDFLYRYDSTSRWENPFGF